MRLSPVTRSRYRIVLVSLLLPFLIADTCAPRVVAGSERDLPDFIVTRDVIARGHVDTAYVEIRPVVGGCGFQSNAPVDMWHMAVIIDTVLSGVVETTPLVVFGMPYQFPSLLSNADVLIYGSHMCSDGWALWGGAVVLSTTGAIEIPREVRKSFSGRMETLTTQELMEQLTSRQDEMPGRAFDSAAAIGLVRVSSIAFNQGRRVITCDSLDVLVGKAGQIPRSLSFRADAQCERRVSVGDSLVLPLPLPSGPLQFCAEGLVIRQSYLPVLATRIGAIERAFEYVDGCPRLRRNRWRN